jgi:hypothetical protein
MPGVASVRFLRFQPGTSLIQRFLEQRKRIFVTALLLFSSSWLLSCSGTVPSGNAAPTASVTAQSSSSSLRQVSLPNLRWCGKPLMIFRDEGAVAAAPPSASAPMTIQNWSQVKPLLGFQVFLPASLPTGSCLVSVYGTVHDPILGGSFTIAYLLPDHTSLSLSEAPLHSSHAGFQCSLAKSDSPSAGTFATPGVVNSGGMQLCSGIRNTSNIVFSAPWSGAVSQAFFQALQADGQWLPAA